jgi:hypothetical protein
MRTPRFLLEYVRLGTWQRHSQEMERQLPTLQRSMELVQDRTDIRRRR